MGSKLTSMKPGRFIHVIGDAHVYEEHVPGLMEQRTRTPKTRPTLHFTREVKNIDDFKMGDFEMKEYKHDEKISFLFKA